MYVTVPAVASSALSVPWSGPATTANVGAPMLAHDSVTVRGRPAPADCVTSAHVGAGGLTVIFTVVVFDAPPSLVDVNLNSSVPWKPGSGV